MDNDNKIKELSSEQLATECFQFMANYARTIYESEVQREASLLQQAARMQTAFSFVTATIFVALPLLIEYRGTLSLQFFLLSISTITATFAFCLFAATMAQNRAKRNDFPIISDFIKLVMDKPESFDLDCKRNKYLSDTYSELFDTHYAANEKRCKWVRISTVSFYVALGLCVFWFVVAIIKNIF